MREGSKAKKHDEEKKKKTQKTNMLNTTKAGDRCSKGRSSSRHVRMCLNCVGNTSITTRHVNIYAVISTEECGHLFRNPSSFGKQRFQVRHSSTTAKYHVLGSQKRKKCVQPRCPANLNQMLGFQQRRPKDFEKRD